MAKVTHLACRLDAIASAITCLLVIGHWSLVIGHWSVVNGQWLVVSCQWLVVSG